MAEPLTRDQLDLLNGLGHDGWSAVYPMPEQHQRQLGELALKAWGEIWRLRALGDVILEAAGRLVTTDEDRGSIADYLTSHIEGEHRLVDATGETRARWPGWDECPPASDGPEDEITEPDHDASG